MILKKAKGELLPLARSPLQPTSSNLVSQCEDSESSLRTLLDDIFMGNELIPDVVDEAPRQKKPEMFFSLPTKNFFSFSFRYPLDLTYKTIRTFPGMKLTAESTR